MKPGESEKNLTPSSTGLSAPASRLVGTVLVVQMELAGAARVMLNDLLAVVAGLLESLARTVKVKVPSPVGVPAIAPVAALRVRPVGNAPLVIAQVYGAIPPVAVTALE
jgi:hypothetical protein